MIAIKATGFWLKIELFIKVNGKIISKHLGLKKDKVESTKGRLLEIGEKEKASFSGIMGSITKDNGKMELNKVMDYGNQKKVIVI